MVYHIGGFGRSKQIASRQKLASHPLQSLLDAEYHIINAE